MRKNMEIEVKIDSVGNWKKKSATGKVFPNYHKKKKKKKIYI